MLQVGNDRLGRNKSTSGKKEHSEGRTLHLILKSGKSGLDIENLDYSYRLTESDEQAFKCEELEIKKYFKKFGEVPPLNSMIPKKYL